MFLGPPDCRLVGEALRHLLDRVIDGELPNEHGPLVEAAREYLEAHARPSWELK